MSANRDGRITDEGVESARSWIGVEREVRGWNSVATEDAIWHFAQGIGDDNPLWWDGEYAAATRWGRMFAPPTFLYSCHNAGVRLREPNGFEPSSHLFPGAFGLWATDRWVWHQPTFAGARIRAVATIVAVDERPDVGSGRSALHTDRISFYARDVPTAGDETHIADCYHSIMRFDRTQNRVAGKYRDVPEARYSDSEMHALFEQYEREPSQRRGAVPRHVGGVAVGDSLGTIAKGPLTVTGLTAWLMGWGSPMCWTDRHAHLLLLDHPGSRLVHPGSGIEDTIEAAHWDLALAQASGVARGYDFGGQRISWFAHLLTDWCGDDGFLTEMTVQVRRPNFLGDSQRLTGNVTAIREGNLVDCEVRATNQRGELTARGTATVRLPD